jgi:hypothetical protein
MSLNTKPMDARLKYIALMLKGSAKVMNEEKKERYE